jgi:hypothetical protein
MSNLASLIGSSVNSSKGVVKIVTTEGNIKARNSDPLGSIALGSDTNKLYIYTGAGWYVINTNPA